MGQKTACQPNKAHRPSLLREYGEAFLVAGVFLVFTQTWILKTVYIPSGSMENTLLVGDHLIVNRFIYGDTASTAERKLLPLRSMKRGDIVVFRSPKEPSLDLVKRCVGLPGDVLELRNKQLYRNGELIDEPYGLHRDPEVGGVTSLDPWRARRDQFGPYRVPAGHYFCLGDNRDTSHDSRFWGPVPETFVRGRAGIIYWSYGGETATGEWPGLASKIVQLVRTGLGFITKTRWRRTFELPA